MAEASVESAPHRPSEATPERDVVTYLDYVQAIPGFNWLYQCLKHEPGISSVWGPVHDYPTRVTIVDSTNGHLDFRTIQDANELEAALGKRGSQVSTRIIVLTYEHPWSFDRKMVLTLGLWFRINPRFFYGNFVYGDEINIITPPKFKRQYTQPWKDALPSQTISFELRQSRPLSRNCNVLSAMSLNPTNSNCAESNHTVLILIRDGMPPGVEGELDPNVFRIDMCRWPDKPMLTKAEYNAVYTDMKLSENTLSASYISQLKAMDLESGRNADHNVMEYVLPYAQILAAEFDNELQSWSTRFEVERNEAIDSSKLIDGHYMDRAVFLLQYWQNDVMLAQRSISRLKNTNAVIKLQNDYNDLMERSQALLTMFRDIINQHVGLLSIQASNESISESQRVNKLTYAAFIFIPLSLITSIFGMNMSEFGSGSVRIWLFFKISVPLLLVSLVYVWWASRRKTFRDHLAENTAFFFKNIIPAVSCFMCYTLPLAPVKVYTEVELGFWVRVRGRGRSQQWSESRIVQIEERISRLIYMKFAAKKKFGRWYCHVQERFPVCKHKLRKSLSQSSARNVLSLPQRWRQNLQLYRN